MKKWFKKQIEIIKDEFKYEPKNKIIKNLLFIVLGATVMAFGDSFFIIPMNIVFGGMSSLSIIFAKLFPIMDVQIYVYIFTWAFFILGFILIGMKYSVHTLLFAIFYPVMISLFSFVIDVAKIDGIHILNIAESFKEIQISTGVIQYENNEAAMQLLGYFVSAIMGGIIAGVGIGLAFIGGGSSGGTDVINILANRYLGIKVGTSSFIVDALIITAGFFTNGYNLLATLVGLISALLCSIMIDKVFMGGQQYYIAMVISEKWKEMNDFINVELGRGTTLIKSKGGYTSDDKYILEICFDRQDYSIIKDMINRIDPDSFVTFLQAKEVLGYGFSRPTPKKKRDSIEVEDTRKLISRARNKRKSTFKEDDLK